MQAIHRRALLQAALGTGFAAALARQGVAAETQGDILRVGMAARTPRWIRICRATRRTTPWRAISLTRW
jgi:hypothetical protein